MTTMKIVYRQRLSSLWLNANRELLSQRSPLNLWLLEPTVTLVTFFPSLFGVSQFLLNLRHFRRIASILANIIANLDGWPTICSGNLNDDVQRL